MAIDPADAVGLDLGVRNFIHDSDGRSIGRLELSDERDRSNVSNVHSLANNTSRTTGSPNAVESLRFTLVC